MRVSRVGSAGGAEVRQAFPATGTSQQSHFQKLAGPAQICLAPANAGQGMLQERSEGDRIARVCEPAKTEEEKAPRRRLLKGGPGRWRGCDGPALQKGRDAAGEGLIRGDERDGLLRPRQAFPDQDSGEARFLRFVLHFDDGESIRCLFYKVFRCVLTGNHIEAGKPVGRGFGGGKRFVDQAATRSTGVRLACIGPQSHVRGRSAEALQRGREGMLRVAGRAGNDLPGVLTGLAIKTGKDHGTLVEAQRSFHQGSGRRGCAGGPRYEDRPLWRVVCPLRSERAGNLNPSFIGFAEPVGFQIIGPVIRDDFQKRDRGLPVGGQLIVFYKAGQLVPVHTACQRGLIQEGGKIAGR